MSLSPFSRVMSPFSCVPSLVSCLPSSISLIVTLNPVEKSTRPIAHSMVDPSCSERSGPQGGGELRKEKAGPFLERTSLIVLTLTLIVEVLRR